MHFGFRHDSWIPSQNLLFDGVVNHDFSLELGNGSVLSIDNLPFHFLPRQYSKWTKCVFVPIRKRSAIHANVIVVSCRSRCAILTFFGSPLGFCPNVFSIQPARFSSSATIRSAWACAVSCRSGP